MTVGGTTGRLPRVAVLGGGMGGLAAAWRLSEPGWRRRFDRIVVYQRGWRLGGKGASSRGPHGRIEEHGLHVWLGFYENAFRLVRECYAELDRVATDPGAPILTWRDAFEPASTIGVLERDGDGWAHWLARFSPNDLEPGDPHGSPRRADPVEFARRGLRLAADIVHSLPDATPPGAGQVVLSASADPGGTSVATLATGALTLAPAALREAMRLARQGIGGSEGDDTLTTVVDALDQVQAGLSTVLAPDASRRRAWELVSLTVALVRGLVVDEAFTRPHRLAQLDDEDYRSWLRRHGAAPDAVDGAFLRGLYDLVFAYEDGDRSRARFGAGSGLLLAMKLALEYRGAVFWKMRAGMGDVVFAPLYQALRSRGVEFEFFHRVDRLILSADRRSVDAIAVGRQARLATGAASYDPLVRVRGLPCFPVGPLTDQLVEGDALAGQPLEAHGCGCPDAGREVLRRGVDFDVAVLAVPPPMIGVVGEELLADRPEWRDMVAHVATVATVGAQLWLREPEAVLGWRRPGTTVSGFVAPFDTWASMPQLIEAEDWPSTDRPRTIAYFCGALAAPWPAAPRDDPSAHVRRTRARLRTFLEREVGAVLPGAVDAGGFRWELLCGGGGVGGGGVDDDGRTGPAALDSQFWTANVDPSDRYVQSLPGTWRYRLRSDESGYDNLVLAGDWTDSGLNAGCIEAAVLSGLQAANAVLGRARLHRVAGYLPG